jgi:opacity protein-like surface antigen
MLRHFFQPVITVSLLVCASLFSAPAFAQGPPGAIVGGEFSAFASESNTDLSFSLMAGYRFNRVFGMGVEVTAVPSLSAGFSPFSQLRRFPFEPADGQAILFTANVRLEIPTTSSRLVPFVIAGGGVANTKESFDAIILASALTLDGFTQSTSLAVPPIPLPTVLPPLSIPPYMSSSTDLALTLGGGISVMATDRLSFDVDLRYLRIVATRDRNVGRFGAGASYRF